MDAAVAACAVQCVVEPQSTGIGGDCFCLIAPGGEEKIVAFNGSGRAPAGAEPDWYAAQGITKINQHTPHAVTDRKRVVEGKRVAVRVDPGGGRSIKKKKT